MIALPVLGGDRGRRGDPDRRRLAAPRPSTAGSGTADARVDFETGVTRRLQGFDPDDGSSSGEQPQAAAAARRSTTSQPCSGATSGRSSGSEAESAGRAPTRGSSSRPDRRARPQRPPRRRHRSELERGSLAGEPRTRSSINTDLAERGLRHRRRARGGRAAAPSRWSASASRRTYRDTPHRGRPVAAACLGTERDAPHVAGRRGPGHLGRGAGAQRDRRDRAVAGGPARPAAGLGAARRRSGAGSGTDDATVAVAVLVVVMALIEVVLLAGPAFAVGARRQSREPRADRRDRRHAAAGPPRHPGRRHWSSGSVGAALGVGARDRCGGGGAAAGRAALLRAAGSARSTCPWPHLAGIAALRPAVSAFLAAVVPAWIASRQDVVAVLAGRRGDRPAGAALADPRCWCCSASASPVSAYGATGAGAGSSSSRSRRSAAVLGMILLVPVVVVGRRAAVAAAAADDAVRRPRRRAAPHPHRPRGGRGRRHRRRCGGARRSPTPATRRRARRRTRRSLPRAWRRSPLPRQRRRLGRRSSDVVAAELPEQRR